MGRDVVGRHLGAALHQHDREPGPGVERLGAADAADVRSRPRDRRSRRGSPCTGCRVTPSAPAIVVKVAVAPAAVYAAPVFGQPDERDVQAVAAGEGRLVEPRASASDPGPATSASIDVTSSASRPASVANGSARVGRESRRPRAPAGAVTTSGRSVPISSPPPHQPAASAPGASQSAAAKTHERRAPYALAGAPEMEAALGPRAQAAEVGSMQEENRRRGGDPEHHRPTSDTRRCTRRPAARSRRRSRRATRSADVRKTASQTTPAVSATHTATPKKTPPHVATIFPPFAKRRKSGRQCPSIAAAPATMPERWCGETNSIPSERRHESLQHVEQHDRHAEPAAVGAPDVRRSDVARADLADVLVLDDAARPSIPTGTSPADSPARRGPRSSPPDATRQGRTPYRCAQSLTTS